MDGALTVVDLSAVQLGVWMSCVLAPESPALQSVVAVQLLGELDVATLRASLRALATRHPALRTTYHAPDDLHARPYQRIHDPGFELVFDHVDAAGWSDAELHDRVRADARILIDVARGPVRVTVYARGSDHVVAFGDHHIGMDLVSVEQYLLELPALYEAALRDEVVAPPPGDVAYVDFVRHQAAFLDSPEAEASIAYWVDRLAGAPMALELPFDHPRPAVRAARGAVHSMSLAPDAVQGLRGLGKSLNRTLLAAFQLLLFRYSGQTDMVTGMPADLRPGPAYGEVMGNFVNMLVLRFDLSGDPTVRELLQHVHGVVSEAAKHRHIPLPVLIERLRPQRDPSTTPFFQVAMGLQRLLRLPQLSAYMIAGATWTTKLGRWDVRSFEVVEHEGQYDFELIASELDGRIWLAFKYNPDLFDRATVERMADNFAVLTAAMVADPDARIGSLPIMTDAERRMIVVDWNQTTVAFPAHRCIHDLVDDAAIRHPDALALVSNDLSLTYGELSRQATSLAWDLRARGIGRDDLVAVALDRGPRAVVAMLGILQAGGAYLSLDPGLPPDRRATIVRDSGARVVITDVDIERARTAPPTGRLDHVNAPTDLAYVIYTSGSTGEPKGVPLQHLGLVNNVVWAQRLFELTAETRVAQNISLSFDGSVLEIWPALACGASLHFVDDETRLSPARLVDWLRDHAIHYAVLPTPLAEACLEGAPSLPAMRAMLAGGDKLHRPKHRPAFRLYNGYGPTEATVAATCAEVTWDAPDELPPIGRPLPNTRVYLLDARLQPVPLGAKGELCIGGITIARGYLGRPELEAEKFVADPFSDVPDARLYRTGDLARYRADGTLEFAGRLDHQVKIRGFRIELGEIEQVLSRHPAVNESLVVVRDVGGRPSLIAYVTGARELLGRAALRSFLAGLLPEYMIPPAFVVLDAFPLTSIGKIDLRALPVPVASEVASATVADTATEARLAALWQRLLAVDTVGVTDDFFELGGDSLTAMELAAAIKRELGCDFLVSELLRHTTIRAQAARIDGWAPGGGDRPTLITLRDGATKPAVVVIHSVLGSVVPYRPLARVLDRPMLGVAAAGAAVSDQLDAIAAAYLRLVRAREPDAPHVFCGWSFSGVVALEMARQLRGATGEVAIVVLIDAPFPPRLSFPETEAELVEQFFAFFLLAADGGSPLTGYVDRTSADPLAEALVGLQARRLIPSGLTPAQVATAYQTFRSHVLALHDHTPRPWDGPLLYLRATGEVARGAWGERLSRGASVPDWRSLCPRLELREIDANHFTILEPPHVAAVGAAINAHLARILGVRMA